MYHWRDTHQRKGYRTRYDTCGKHHAGHKDVCPKGYSVPADPVESHILGLIREDLRKLRDDDQLHRHVDRELRRVQGHQYDARDQLRRRLASLDQKLAKLRDHMMAMKPELAESLGLYQQAEDVASERSEVEAQLAAIVTDADLPPVGELRRRIAAEFDRLESVMASGTVEERRSLIGCYVHEIKADPDTSCVRIGLYPTLYSQKIVLAGLWS